jgi:hypothetical protein
MRHIYDLAIQGRLLFLLILTLLDFSTAYPRGIALMDGMVLVILAWIIKMLQTGRFQVMRTLLNLPMLLFIVQIVSDCGWGLRPL